MKFNDMHQDVPLHDLKKGGISELFKSINKKMKSSIGEQMERQKNGRKSIMIQRIEKKMKRRVEETKKDID